MALIALYWLSGLAFVIEPVRWAVGGKARRARAERRLIAARVDVERRRAGLLEAQRQVAGQRAWAEWDRRNREYWQAAEAYRAAQPASCGHCRQLVGPAEDRCPHCGAPIEAGVR